MPDDAIVLEVDPAGMQAILHLPAGASLPASSALDRMMKANVVAGVVEETLREVETPSPDERHLVVARGVPAVQPVDARVEVLVNFALRLTEDTQHHIDFREQGRFHEVAAGTVLARLIPKAAGTPGRTVLGRDLPVGDPRDADLTAFAGEGTVIQAVGDGQVAAERAGLVVRRRDGHLDIMPSVEIPGNLDMHWGNLVTLLPVTIKGDIIAGFSLKSGAEVMVRGVIEDARVSVKGNLACGGILPGEHRVKTHGDLVTKYAAGRELKCRNLIVASDVRGGTVYATDNVTAKLIVSCQVHCGGSLVCDELGSPAELGGCIQVGVNPLAVALYRLAARERETIEKEVAEGKRLCKRLAMWVRDETDPTKRQELAGRLRKTLTDYESATTRLAHCEAVLNNAVLRNGNNPEATVTVNQTVHAGVEIRIGTEAKLAVTKTMGKTVFRLKDGRIAWDVPRMRLDGTPMPESEAAAAATEAPVSEAPPGEAAAETTAPAPEAAAPPATPPA